MRLLLATSDVDFSSPVFGEGTLESGTVYFTFGKFAKDIASSNGGILIEEPPPVPLLDPQALRNLTKESRILLIHSGGYGDTITVGILLTCLMEKYGLDVDVCCHRDKHDFILRPMGVEMGWLPFPPPVERLKPYDYALTDLAAMAKNPMDLLRRSPLDVLAEVFDLSIKNHGVRYQIPAEYRARMQLPITQSIRVGIHFDAMGRVKSLPEDLQSLLILKLLSLNLELHVFGRKSLSNDLLESHPGIHNHANNTTIPEMAALLHQMDLVVGVDSFVAHLSGLLGKRTLVLLSTTTADYFHHYPAVSSCSSAIACAPCFHVNHTCPRGHHHCHAFYHTSMDPDALVSRIVRELSNMHDRWDHG